jgi:hypothetical protein
VLPSGQILTLALLVPITLEVVPFHTYAPFPELVPIFRLILEVVICEGDLPSSPQLCQNGGLSVLSLIGETEKVRCVGKTVLSFFVRTPWWKSKCETVRCSTATAASYFVAKVRSEVFAHFHALAITHHSSIWLWPARKNFLWIVPLVSKKMMSMLFICLVFSCLRDFGLSLHGLWLSNHCQGLHRTFSVACTEVDAVVGSITKSHQARYRTPNIRTQKISTFSQLREIMYTCYKDILVLSSNFHRATTIAVQMAALDPEIMDIPFYMLHSNNRITHQYIINHKQNR